MIVLRQASRKLSAALLVAASTEMATARVEHAEGSQRGRSGGGPDLERGPGLAARARTAGPGPAGQISRPLSSRGTPGSRTQGARGANPRTAPSS